MKKLKYLFIHIKIQDGEREHDHRVLHTTYANNLDFAVERYVASFWGWGERLHNDDVWYWNGGEFAGRLESYKELSKKEYYKINKLFYG